VNATGLRGLDRLQRARDILVECAAKRGNRGISDRFGYGINRVEIAIRRRREAGFNDINTHALKLARDA